MQLNKNIYNLRKAKGFSQEYIAEQINVSRQTISNWENSKSYPDIIMLIKLCDIYKISLDDLLKEDQELLNHIKKEKQKKNKIIITCISIIIILLTLLSYFVFFKDYFKTNDSMKKEIQAVVENKEQFIEITKAKKYNEDEMTDNYIKINDTEFKNITSYLDNNNYEYKTVFRFTNLHIESTDTIGYVPLRDIMKIKHLDKTTPFSFWAAECDIVEYKNFDDFFKVNIIGKKTSDDNEMMISNVLANIIITSGIETSNGDFYPSNYEEIINNENFYYFGNSKIKIVGIIDYDLSKFDKIKEITWEDLNNNYEKYGNIYDEFSLKTRNVYNKVYVNKNFISNLRRNNNSTSNEIWQKNITRTGILVIENDKNKLTKLFKRYNSNPYEIKSTYSEMFD